MSDSSKPASKPVSRPAARRGRVLVVDDELAQRTTLEGLLSEEFDVVAVVNVDRARAELEKRRFDVALVDYGLPDAPGSRLVEIARERFPDVVLIMLTAHDQDPNVLALRTETSIPVLRKPCSPEVIIGAVRSAIALSRMRVAQTR